MKAKGRHGVHSPFVYDFIEKILNGKLQVIKPAFLSGANFSERQRVLIERICNYYVVHALFVENRNGILPNAENTSGLHIYSVCSGLKFPFNENDIVVVRNIYSTGNQLREWNALCQNQEVRLSIDVFEMGILFFRKDFLVKQHFILKY